MTSKPSAKVSRDEAIDKLVEVSLAAGPLGSVTDKYFTNTRMVVEANGEKQVTYAVFLRRRCIAALEPAERLITRLVPEAKVTRFYDEGEIVPAERKLMEVSGPMSKLSEVETLLLQKTGFPSVSAANAFEMCMALPACAFIDMHARHGSGVEMNMLAAYGASVGSQAARKANKDVRGFVGSSQDVTAPMFGAMAGIGTMPHALVGYADGDVLEATRMFAERLPDIDQLVALVDYQGLEITDALRTADWFFNDAKLHEKGKTLGVRLDTHGGRFAEGLDYDKSVDTVGNCSTWTANTTSWNTCSARVPSSSTRATSWSTRCAECCSARACRLQASSIPARRWTRQASARRTSWPRRGSLPRSARSWGLRVPRSIPWEPVAFYRLH
jgi:nicotinate phosphoribosyltransferase